MKKMILIAVAIILVAAIAVAAVLILGGKDKSPVKVESASFSSTGERGITSYLHFQNTDSEKEIDSITFMIHPCVGKEIVKGFTHTDTSNIDAGYVSKEYVWRDYFPSSPYTFDDLTKVKIAVTAYKFVGEDTVTIEKPFWYSFNP